MPFCLKAEQPPHPIVVSRVLITMSRILVAVVAACVLAGCGVGSTTVISKEKPENAAASSTLSGRWKGSIELPKKENDPANEMARGMAEMLGDTLSLEFPAEGKFRLSMMGMPVEGALTLDGDKVNLNPELIGGLPPEEAAKQNASSGTAADIERFKKPMKGTLSADKKTITLEGDKPDDGKLVFTYVEPRKPGPDSVSADEKSWVGLYKPDLSRLDESKLSEEDRKQLPMMKSVLGASTITLSADNVAEIVLVMDMKGTWKLKDGNVVIEFPKETTENGSSQAEPMTLVPQKDGKSLELVNSGGGPSVTFVRG